MWFLVEGIQITWHYFFRDFPFFLLLASSGGFLLTVAFQIFVDSAPTAKILGGGSVGGSGDGAQREWTRIRVSPFGSLKEGFQDFLLWGYSDNKGLRQTNSTSFGCTQGIGDKKREEHGKIIDVSNPPPTGHSKSLLVQTFYCPSFALGTTPGSKEPNS
ncbi:hypothetical protein PIB30_065660 [Stylosanthes scabra]|uniref:Uncharacterized protein n=1 Tax=Stylosanthes scabra TaxID=79078 RepID=A0ABU6YQE1_9FABA|nr:hypothetical protein [Stylosanthes scabra]